MTRRTSIVLLLVAAAAGVWVAWMLARQEAGERRAGGRGPVLQVDPTDDARADAPPSADEADAESPAPAEDPDPDPAPEEKLPPYPPDPVETGPCALSLRAVDVESGEPVEARVELWRLDAPGNEHWTDGDQRQASVEVAREGTLVEELPVGRYRVFVLSQPEGGTDPEEFHVAGGRTELTIPVRTPREFAVRVRLLDPGGTPLTEVHRLGTRRSWSVRTPAPEWRRARRLREPLGYGFGHGGGVSMGSSGRRTVRAGDDGLFLFGSFPEDVRDRAWRRRTWFTPEGYLDVRIEVRELATDALFEAVCVPQHAYAGLVRLPDGSDAAQAGARVELWIEAVAVDPANAPGSTRHEPIHLRATLKGYETLESEFPRDAPPPALVLRPIESD